jgi:hypothetical protein
MKISQQSSFKSLYLLNLCIFAEFIRKFGIFCDIFLDRYRDSLVQIVK